MQQPLEEGKLSMPRSTDIATTCIYGLSILSAGLFLLLPLASLLSPSPWQRNMGIFHGTASLLSTIVVAYAGHMAFPLLRGAKKYLPQIRTLSFWSTVLSFLAIATGNWVYMRYQAPENGAKAWLLENTPLVHYLFMTYHEFTTLFTLPLGVACTWILWRYGDRILDKENRAILAGTSLALMAMMFFAMGGFISGLNVSRIHSL
ncbi:MAG: hypothetical protein AAF889_12275 [Cyanobacteria bacterium P01_D01_bin.73]